MLLNDQLDKIYREQLRITEEEVLNLFQDFIKKSPVDTGNFRSSWSLEPLSETSWVIRNNAEYATILYDGRRFAAGQMLGSEQWPEGGDVMVEKFIRVLQRRIEEA